MLDTLVRICDEGGPLVGVAYLIFEREADFVTTIGLRFGSLSAVFRAVESDDTLLVSLGTLVPSENETLFEVTHSAPWSACVGMGIRWAWRLTNQQGYSDGVRMEFGNPDERSSTVVELIVAASAIQIFVVENKNSSGPLQVIE